MIGVYITATYGFMIFFMELTGMMARYIHPDTGRLNLAAAFILFLLSLAGIAAKEKGNHHSPPSLGEKLGYGILLLPLLLTLLFPAKDLSASLLNAKGIHLVGYPLPDTVDGSKYDQKAHLTAGTEATGILSFDGGSFLSSADLIERFPGAFTGRPVLVEGFSCYPPGASGNMVTARYIINHCAADARAIGMVVHLDGLAAPPQDSWVRVEGVLGCSGQNLVIHARKITRLAKPESGYIYH